MSISQNDGPDDSESGRMAAEQSETRMRQALDRLSGDRLRGERAGGDRSGGGDRLGSDRPAGSPRSQASTQASFSSAGPRRHRYVQDGEVPVVQISANRDRRRDLSGAPPTIQEPPADQSRVALDQERTARLRAEQALDRAQATIHGLETRLGHAEITQRESEELARTHLATTAQLQAELSESATRLKAAQLEANEAQRRVRELEAELEAVQPVIESAFDELFEVVPEPPPLRARAKAAPARAATPKTAAPRAAVLPVQDREPEPVQWWLIPPSKPKAKSRRG